eukprot:SAG22_NODE_568_length_9030_cov_2.503527_11_plen_81_part_00
MELTKSHCNTVVEPSGLRSIVQAVLSADAACHVMKSCSQMTRGIAMPSVGTACAVAALSTAIFTQMCSSDTTKAKKAYRT